MGESVAVKITALQVENVKRVKAVHLTPQTSGLTILGGRNGQGKTSVLDAIAWALGGNKQAPSNAQRDGAMSTPEISLTLSNGIQVERKGKNATLTVTDPSGQKAGQSLLDSFVSTFALNLPKFLNASETEKAQTILKILGVGDQLFQLEANEKRVYNERTEIGRIADSKKKYAEELPEYPDTPDELVSVSELNQQQQSILAINGENQRKRSQLLQLQQNLAGCKSRIQEVEASLVSLRTQEQQITSDIATASKTVEQLRDESTAEIETSLSNIETINAQVMANNAKSNALSESNEYTARYAKKTDELESIRKQRFELLNSANLPLAGLTVEDGKLLYNGKSWDCMSGSEQLRVSVAIVRKLSPGCGFVLLDKLEQMDLQTLQEFGAWLESENLQVIATRVSTGEECSIVIEDGLPLGETYADVVTGVSVKNETKENSWSW